MLGPQTWVRLITLKKQPNIQTIFSRCERKLSKNYFLKMCGHSKLTSDAWSMIHLSHRPSEPANYILDCWISTRCNVCFIKIVLNIVAIHYLVYYNFLWNRRYHVDAHQFLEHSSSHCCSKQKVGQHMYAVYKINPKNNLNR